MKLARFVTFASLCLFVNTNNLRAEEATAVVEPNTGTPIEKMEPASRPLNLIVELLNGANITGTLVDVDVVSIKTAFGEAAIPLTEVAGIRFATREDVTTTVVMINGDSITGATDVKLVTVETDWGTAKINGSSIQSMLLIPNLKWSSNSGVSGKRWALIDAKVPEPTAPPAVTATPASGSTRSATPGSLPAGTYLQNGVLYRSGTVSQE